MNRETSICRTAFIRCDAVRLADDQRDLSAEDFPRGRLLGERPDDDSASCQFPVPYPAPGAGLFIITCLKCNRAATFCALGRPTDPRAVMLPCTSIRTSRVWAPRT